MNWSDYVDLLKPVGQLEELTWDRDNDQLKMELYRQAVMNISLGYFLYFQSSPQHPDWSPLLNSVFLLQPNPDDVYLIAPVESSGTYRISGQRGTVRMVTFSTNYQAPGMSEDLSGTRAYDLFDIDELTIDQDGNFEVILSEERPPGHDGDWWYLNPEAGTMWVRQRSYDWYNEREVRLAIERIDEVGQTPKPRMPKEEIHQKLFELLSGFPLKLARKLLNHQNELKEGIGINRAELASFGGVLPIQRYWQAAYDFSADEALIIECDIPDTVKYWNVQTNDELFNAVEFVYRQSSLNGHQAHVCSDGKFRAVLAVSDPGVPNWLDSGGSLQGTLIGRWYDASSAPIPTFKQVPLSELRTHLPPDTPVIDSEQRNRILRQRKLGAQLRRRW